MKDDIIAVAGSFPSGSAKRSAIDLPTIGITAATYAAFLFLTWNYSWIPWWLLLPLGAVTVALQGSLQHEATHGYPTKWEGLNTWIVGWPLWLWLPYLDYRVTHRLHHIDENLTDPLLDPESTYLTAETIKTLPKAHLAIRYALKSLGGRMIIGPAYFAVMTIGRGIKEISAGNKQAIKAWGWHLAGVAVILYWVMGWCHMPFWDYVAFFAYPGTAFTLVRSFAEHRAVPDYRSRTVICEAGWFWSFLFLNNNLHKIHHEYPSEAWHRRPATYRKRRAEFLAANGGYLLSGYNSQFLKYFLRAKDPLEHPFIHDRPTNEEKHREG